MSHCTKYVEFNIYLKKSNVKIYIHDIIFIHLQIYSQHNIYTEVFINVLLICNLYYYRRLEEVIKSKTNVDRLRVELESKIRTLE